MISAIATVATRPEMLEKVFVKTDTERGLYGIRLFDQVWECLSAVLARVIPCFVCRASLGW